MTGMMDTVMWRQHTQNIHSTNKHYNVPEDNLYTLTHKGLGSRCQDLITGGGGWCAIGLRFNEFRELAQHFLEGSSDLHRMTGYTLDQGRVEQYHLLPY